MEADAREINRSTRSMLGGDECHGEKLRRDGDMEYKTCLELAVFHRVFREGLHEKVTFKQRLEEEERVGPVRT